MAFNPDFQSIGEAFTQHYYSAFDVADAGVRAQTLYNLYDVGAAPSSSAHCSPTTRT